MAKEKMPQITHKISLTGRLQLLSPLLIGSGETPAEFRSEVDKFVLRNGKEQPLIPGTSLAGVLREWLYAVYAKEPAIPEQLCGKIDKGGQDENGQWHRGSNTGLQSALNVMDVVLEKAEIIYRDGVALDTYTGTAIEGAKYDFEAVERGAEGQFCLLVTLRREQEALTPRLLAALEELAKYLAGGFAVGALTAKGFGRVRVRDVRMVTYDFHEAADIRCWLRREDTKRVYVPQGKEEPLPEDFVVEADFALRTALLVRDGNTDAKDGENSISAVQKKSRNDYCLPGSSLKGALRHRAERILQQLGRPESLLEQLMGSSRAGDKARKSRFIVQETYFREGVEPAAQSRNRIDRFTNATMEHMLFTTQPVWQQRQGERSLHIGFSIKSCKPWEAGLALLLLRDLWLGDLALGGERSIGRGRLEGLGAVIHFEGGAWQLDKEGRVSGKPQQELERFAQALQQAGEQEEATV